MEPLPKIIAVVGTTASGKSALAVHLAKKFHGEVISVDSRQIYQDMDIGTNKEPGQLQHVTVTDIPDVRLPADCPVSMGDVLSTVYMIEGVPHYLISIVRPDQMLTLAHIKALADGVISHVLSKGKLPILVGGTGLYTTALLQNWQLPEGLPNMARRKELEALTVEELGGKLKKLDPLAYASIDAKNPRRLIRAIEMAQEGQGAGRAKRGPQRYESLLIAPTIDRDVLHARIDRRVDAMVKAGLVEEVKRVAETYGYDCVAMTGHAYQQIGWYLQGKMPLQEAIALSKKVTRAYAKRQKTWWKKYGPVLWVSAPHEAEQAVAKFLAESV